MLWRVIVSIVAITLSGIVRAAWSPVETIVSGQAAGNQFIPSDAAAIHTAYTFSTLHYIDVMMGGVLLVFLILLWAKPIVNLFTTSLLLALLVAVVASVYPPTPSKAFFQTTDKTEAYTILPNQSAFWIPDTGDNETAQMKFDSKEYLDKKKIGAKRFIIPHAKLTNTGGSWGWDSYVPTGRLIIVDRSTYSHEWVDATDRGTSQHKEGFPCQSNDGINITAGVSVGARVDETDAALFLYNFGVVTPTNIDTSNPEVIFQSVYQGRSLTSVMQDVGRKKIQTLVCNEIGSRDFVTANKEMVRIMTTVEHNTTEYFKTVGITITFIGWADTFGFDSKVQAAVNSVYEITVESQNYAKLLPYVDVIKTFATAEAIKKFNGAMPSTYVGELPGWIAPLMTSARAGFPPVPATPAPTGAK